MVSFSEEEIITTYKKVLDRNPTISAGDFLAEMYKLFKFEDYDDKLINKLLEIKKE